MSAFRERVALVTGAGSGIGAALARELAARGAQVVLADVDLPRAEAHAVALREGGGNARAIALDVSDENAFVAACDDVREREGAIDFLFNNAGIAVGGDVLDIAPDDWRRIVAVNLWGVVNGVRAVYPAMAARRSGHIVNTASVAGLVPFAPMTPYAMTKHAVVGLSLSLRAEAAALGVRVTAACPGFIETGIYAAARVARVDGERASRQLAMFRPMRADRAARRILDGVARNRALLVFPLHARVLWWLSRVSPALLGPVGRYTVSRFRALRDHAG